MFFGKGLHSEGRTPESVEVPGGKDKYTQAPLAARLTSDVVIAEPVKLSKHGLGQRPTAQKPACHATREDDEADHTGKHPTHGQHVTDLTLFAVLLFGL